MFMVPWELFEGDDKGSDKGSEGRKVRMYLCQKILDAQLVKIAVFFNFGHGITVSFIIHQIR
ncbi:hypothetical protein CJF42_25325 [Pseudoalteromonas sp. NBT06-2]|nr:hypothetical protein CJF42_25325 [Pseudoalteromonas sp. NBT06-2]